MQKIVPHLWFDTEAEQAAEFYCRTFPNSKIISKAKIVDTPSGDCDFMTFNLNGHDFMAISAGPDFKINPSISFLLNFDPSQDPKAEENLRILWEKLADGGAPLMPLQEYSFSKLYGWIQDRFGVTWQLMLTDPSGEPRPFITPSLMFSQDNTNKAEEAITFYVETFKGSKAGTLARYPEAAGPANQGSIMYGDFMIENQWHAAMDSGVEQSFTFNEGVSLLVNCDTQEEIDYYSDKLSAVPEAEQCGWVKDRYGVSWQLSPTAMNDMFQNGTREQIDRMSQTFLKMKRLDIAKIEAAFNDTGTN